MGSTENTRSNLTVIICRVLGMFMIILCHIGTSIGNSAIGEIFQVGVQLFLFISGYLYGSKKIEDKKKWLWNRFLRISIPCYIFLLFLLCILVSKNIDIHFESVLLYLLNLQGYQHIVCFLPAANNLIGAAHLWFITIIMLCYFLVIILNKNTFILRYKNLFLYSGLFIVFIMGFAGIRLDYFWIFFLGYILSYNSWSFSRKGYMISTFLMVFAAALRLSVKRYCDIAGDNYFYLYIVIPFAYNIIALWIFETVEMLNKILDYKKVFQYRIIAKFFQHLDRISFYVYITHYIFIDKPLNIVGAIQPAILNVLFGSLLLWSFGFALQKLSDLVISKL